MISFLPPEASTIAPGIDLLFAAMSAFSFGLGSLLVFLVVRYSIVYRKGSKADRSGRRRRGLLLEVGWTSAAIVVAFTFFAWSAGQFEQRDAVPAGAISVSATPKQWMWRFSQANGKREINVLHVPIHTPVVVELTSEDVIHSLYIPAFRIKQDAVPGRTTRVWFEATELGTFDLFCAEYCGMQHSKMRGKVVVMPKADFATWLSAKIPETTLAEQGEAMFRSFGCSGCHGPDSEVRAPDLHGVFGNPVALSDGSVVTADEAYVHDSVLQPARQVAAGYEPIMPSFAGIIRPEELEAITAYLKSIGRQDGGNR